MDRWERERPSPVVDRPAIPAEYGLARATEFVEWTHVEDRLASATAYWIATAGTDGRPSVRPIDGVYLDGVLYVGGSPETRWVADLGRNPSCAVHLDGLDDVVIVEGRADVLRSVDEGTAERMAAASNAKYPQYAMKASFYVENGAIAIRIRSVVTWTDIGRDPTRFRFED